MCPDWASIEERTEAMSALHRIEASVAGRVAFLVVVVLAATLARSAAPPAAHAVAFTEMWRVKYNVARPIVVSDVRMAVDSSTTAVFIAGDYGSASGGRSRIVLRKVSSAGKALWTVRYAPTGRDVRVLNVAAGPSGSVYLAGTTSKGGNSDWLLAKYSASGKRAWLRTADFSGRDGDAANGLAVTSGGRAYVAGVGVFAKGNADAVTRAYSSAGRVLWTRRYNGAAGGTDGASDIALGLGGDVFVAGWAASAPGETDVLLLHYAPAGLRLAAATDGAPATSSTASAVAVWNDTVYVAGGRRTGKQTDALTEAFGLNGSRLWADVRGGGGTDEWNVAVAVTGNIVLTDLIAAAGYSGGSRFTDSSASITVFDPSSGTYLAGDGFSGSLATDAAARDVLAGRDQLGLFVVSTGYYGTGSGSRMTVRIIWPGMIGGGGLDIPSSGQRDRGEELALTSDAFYVAGVLDNTLALVRLTMP
jgi:hypothetical protein